MDALARARTLGVIVDRMTALRGKGERPVGLLQARFSECGRRAPSASEHRQPQDWSSDGSWQQSKPRLSLDRLNLMPGGPTL